MATCNNSSGNSGSPGIMANIMSMFSSAGGASVNTPAQQGQPARTGGSVTAPTTALNPGDNNAVADLNAQNLPANPSDNNAEKSPLEDFSKLWDNPVVDPNAVAPVNPLDALNFDPVKLSELAKKLDFTKGLDPALLAKAQAGDAAAFAAVLNYTTQNSFAQAMHAMGKVAQSALEKQAVSLRAELPEHIRKGAVTQSLSDNPLYNHPASQPLVLALETQMRTKYPTANANEITKHVISYFDGLVKVAQGKQTPEQTRGHPVFGTDAVEWGEFFGLDPVK